MKFKRLKDSLERRFTFEKRSRASTSAHIEFSSFRYEDTPEPETPPIFNHSRSLKEILLPPIKRHKPLTISNFLAIGNSITANTPTLSHSDLNPPQVYNAPHQRAKHKERLATMRFPSATNLLRRKAVGESSGYTPPTPRFDPKEARKDPALHAHARQVLLKRYKSKFTYEFNPHNNQDMSTYEFIWAGKGVLEAKVLEDIMFVRERFAFAGKNEPTDKELIHWYDAEAFDVKDVDADEVTMVCSSSLNLLPYQKKHADSSRLPTTRVMRRDSRGGQGHLNDMGACIWGVEGSKVCL